MSRFNSIYCPSCQCSTNLNIYQQPIVHGLSGGISYRMAECNHCNQMFLIEQNQTGAIQKYYPNILPQIVDPSLPDFIKSDLQETYNTYSIQAYRATAVLARRILQAICIDHKAPTEKPNSNGKMVKVNLVEQIDWMCSQGIVTNQIKDWAHQVRMVGNDGAHPSVDLTKADNVTQTDADDILQLLEALINTLYTVPQTSQSLQSRRTQQVP